MADTRDLTQINDEDVLRKMWADADDFGRKKEIRAHMYKLRENRLREFYTTGEVSKDIQRAHSSPGLRDNQSKSFSVPTHADSLADHSFLSLKSKEIRDSESPTRDVHYNNRINVTGDRQVGVNQGWNVVSKTEQSDDGKTVTSSRLATKSGSEKIQGGVANFDARAEEKTSVFQDGDDKNFTKAVGASSKSVVRQEAVGGDDNNSFRSSSTTTSSSSRVVTEHKSSSGDADVDIRQIRGTGTGRNDDGTTTSTSTVVRKTYTSGSDIPDEIRNNPNTKVYTETKTLPDGTKVTTTRYETKDVKTSGSSSYQTSTQKYSTHDDKNRVIDVRPNEEVTIVVKKSTTNPRGTNETYETVENVHKNVHHDVRNVHHDVRNVQHDVRNVHHDVRNVHQDVRNVHHDVRNVEHDVRNVQQDVRNVHHDVRNVQQDIRNVHHDVKDVRNVQENVHNVKNIRENVHVENVNVENVHNVHQDVKSKKTASNQRIVREEVIVQPTTVQETHVTETYITDKHGRVRKIQDVKTREIPQGSRPSPIDDGTTSKVTKTTTTVTETRTTDGNVANNFINVEKEHVKDTDVRNDTRRYIVEEKVPRRPDTENITTEVRRTITNDDKMRTNDVRNDSRIIREKIVVEEDRTPVRRPVDESTTTTTTTTTKTTTKKTGDYPKDEREPEPVRRREPSTPKPEREPSTPRDSCPAPKQPQQPYEQPERRQPIKPGKSEMDQKLSPTDGQYETTYRTDFTNKKISVEVSPTHDAFARSLRSVTPERVCKTPKTGSKTSLRTSTSSLRHSTSPDKYPNDRRRSPEKHYTSPNDYRHPSRVSPDRSQSPTKKTPERTTYNTDTITRRRKDDTTSSITTTTTTSRRPSDGNRPSSVRPNRNDDYPRGKSPSKSTTVITTTTTTGRKPSKPDDNEPYYPRGKSPSKTTKTTTTTTTTSSTGRRPSKQSPEDIDEPYYPRGKSPSKTTDREPYYPKETSPSRRVERITTTSEVTDMNRPSSGRRPSDSPTNRSPIRRPNEFTSTVQEHTQVINKKDEVEIIDSNTLTRKSKKQPQQPRSRSPSPSPTTRTTTKTVDVTTKKTVKGRSRSPSPTTSLISETTTQTKTTDVTKKSTNKGRSRSPSPTSTTSDFEYIRNTSDVVTDLDVEEHHPSDRPTSLEITETTTTTRKHKKVTDRSPTSPLTDFGVKPTTTDGPKHDKDLPKDRPFKRTDTYEERCRQILGIPESPKPERKQPRRKSNELPKDKEPLDKPREKSPTKKVQEFPSQVRKSPTKEPLEKPREKSPTKSSPTKVQEFPSQVRKSPTKEPLEKPREKSPTKKSPTKIQEFPSQIRKSPTKEPLEKPREKSPTKSFTTKIQEFPSQVRKSPTKEPLEKPREKSPTKKTPTKIQEFPSHVRKSPTKEPLEKPKGRSPVKDTPSKIQEFPSQIRKSPVKEPLEKPRGKSPVKDSPSKIQEFPSQVRKSPTREPLEKPRGKSPVKDSPSKIQEFPSQVSRKSPTREPLEKPRGKSPVKDTSYPSTIQEFPSQTRKPSSSTISSVTTTVTSKTTSNKQKKNKTKKPTEETSSSSSESESEEYLRRQDQEDVEETTTSVIKRRQPTTATEYVTEEDICRPQQRKPRPETFIVNEREDTNITLNKTLTIDRPEHTKKTTTRINQEFITSEIEDLLREAKKPEYDDKPKSRYPEDDDDDETPRYPDDDKPRYDRQETYPVNGEEPKRNKPRKNVDDDYPELGEDEENQRTPTSTATTTRTRTEKVFDIIETEEERKPNKAVLKPNKTTTTSSTTIIKKINGIHKPDTPKTQKPKTTVVTTKTKMVGQTEYTDQYGSRKPLKPNTVVKKPTKVTLNEKRITLEDVENIDNVDRDVTIHIRTQRIEDGTTRKKTQIPDHRTPVVKTAPVNKPRTPLETTTKKTYRTEKVTTIEDHRFKPKTTTTPTRTVPSKTPIKPDNKRHVVSAIINVTPKKKPEVPKTSKTVSQTVTSTTKTTKVSSTQQPKITSTTTTTRVTSPKKPHQQVIKIKNKINRPEDVETDSELEEVEEIEIVSLNKRADVIRRVPGKTQPQIKNKQPQQAQPQPQPKSPAQTKTKPAQQPKAPINQEKPTCVTTKSILIENKVADQREIIVNLHRSKSSREQTPDRICPRPMTSDEEDDYKPRYPDEIREPEESQPRRPKNKLTEISETDDYKRVVDVTEEIEDEEETVETTERITKIRDSVKPDHRSAPLKQERKAPKNGVPIEETDSPMFERMTVKPKKITEVDKVPENDESLLTVTEKVSKFLTTAEKLKNKKPDSSSPAPKQPRPKIEVDEDLESDDCLLSVSDKVSKFITTAEQLTTSTSSIPDRPKSPRCTTVIFDDNTEERYVDENDESLLSVSEKVSKFITTAEKVKEPQNQREPRREPTKRFDDEDIDETIREDDCLLSVSDKVTKFINTAEKLTTTKQKQPVSLEKIVDKPQKRPEPERRRSTSPNKKSPERFNTTECVQIEDEEHLYTRRPSSPKKPTTREMSPIEKTPTNRRPSDYSTKRESVEEVRKYSTTRRDSHPEPETPKSTRRPSQDDHTKSILSSTSRLRSTESIKKAKALFENISNTTQREITRQKDILNRPSVFEAKKLKTPDVNDRKSPERKYGTTDEVHKYTSETERRTSTSTSTSSRQSPERKYSRRTPSPVKNVDYDDDDDDVKLVDIGVRRRPSDSSSRVRTKLHYSSDEEQEQDEETCTRLRRVMTSTSSTQRKSIDDGLKSTKLVMMEKSRRPASPEKENYAPRSRESSVDKEIPGYMKPLDRSLRPNSPHLENLSRMTDEVVVAKSPAPIPVDETEGRPTKFGVTLRRTDSGKRVTTSTTSTTTTTTAASSTLERRRSSTTEKTTNKTELDIEEIFDLEMLEELLEQTTSYDIRRRIRAQIRVVKKLISEGKLEITVSTKKTTSKISKSPERVPKQKSVERHVCSKPSHNGTTEYQSKYTRKTSPVRKPVDNQLQQHTEIFTNGTNERKSSTTEYQYSYSEKRRSSQEVRNKSPETINRVQRQKSPETKQQIKQKSPERRTVIETIVREVSPKRSTIVREVSPKRSMVEKKTTKTETTRVFQTELKKVPQKPKIVKNQEPEKPEWAQKTLRKVTDKSSPLPVAKKAVTSSSTSSTVVKKEVSRRTTSPSKDKPLDVITSSYGVGPTDENGTPLFGLRALRAQKDAHNTNVSSKVQGTVITSHYYSENGDEPIGEVSVTKYSTDPKDLGSDDEEFTSKNDGLLSKTTTQKFGYKGTPTLKSLQTRERDNKKLKQIESSGKSGEEKTKITTTSTTKVSRRGSVKELQQKFIDNAVETLKSERQTSYPKAGLILRTSSFKDSGKEILTSSREGSPEQDDEEVCRTVRTTTRTTTSKAGGDTFLTNKSRVTGMQDVISRMRNSTEVEEGETLEDAEAKNLLNKFLGSQVILSGIESTQIRPSTSSTVRKSTTKVTTTSTEGGKPKSITRTFEHPVSEEDINNIWDEDTLRLLLEQSTEYEERRNIRARLREVMAEQQACAELVKNTKEKKRSSLEREDEEEKHKTEKVETKTVIEGPVTTTTKVTTRMSSQQVKKPMSPFAKFQQLDRQNSVNSPSSPNTPKTPTGGPLFKFTDPALSKSASTIKERLLQWCQMKTKEYENVQLDNFSSSWADGLAFCALIHHFLPDAFDYHALSPKNRRHNFTLAFQVADEKAGIAPLLDVDDMVACRKPDWKCVFTYVQTIYKRFKDEL